MAAIATSTVPVATAVTVRPQYLEWGPVILGALGATAISVVLLTFGAALGLSVVSPYPYAGISAKGLAVLTGTYVALVTVASFGAGGYLAGRLRSPWTGAVGNEVTEAHFRDGSHGFGVWALAVLLGSALAVSGVGGVLKAAVGSTTAVAAAGRQALLPIPTPARRSTGCRWHPPTSPSIACWRPRLHRPALPPPRPPRAPIWPRRSPACLRPTSPTRS